jgi:hypothetical protein
MISEDTNLTSALVSPEVASHYLILFGMRESVRVRMSDKHLFIFNISCVNT